MRMGVLSSLFGTALLLGESLALAGPLEDAQELVRESGVTGGLVVHVGCSDGRFAEGGGLTWGRAGRWPGRSGKSL